MADYVSAMEGTNVVKTVFLETDAAKDHLELEASFVGKLCADPSVPVAGAVIGCSLDDSAGFKEYIDKMRVESYIKGVRDVMHPKEKGFCLKPEVLSNIQYLGESGLSCDICIQPDQLSDAAEMVRQCPGTTFISVSAVRTRSGPALVPCHWYTIVRD
jgi:L-fuconolactonase